MFKFNKIVNLVFNIDHCLCIMKKRSNQVHVNLL